MHEAIKRTFDPKGLLNPGKKLARGLDPVADPRLNPDAAGAPPPRPASGS